MADINNTAKQYPKTWSRGTKHFVLDGENVAAADASLRLQRGRRNDSALGAMLVLYENTLHFVIFDDEGYWETSDAATTAQETVRNCFERVSQGGGEVKVVFDADDSTIYSVEDADDESPMRDASDFVTAFKHFGGKVAWQTESAI